MNRASLSTSILKGTIPLHLVDPFPLMSSGRKQQVEQLLKSLRESTESKESIHYLRSWDLLKRVPLWSMPMRVRAISALGQFNPSGALSLICHTALGINLINQFKASNAEFDSPSAEFVFAYAMTEETPASDLAGLQSMATEVEGGFRINGKKSWVTNATQATHFIMLCRTHHFYPGEKPGLTAFVLTRSQVKVKPVSSPVLCHSGLGEIEVEDSFVGSSAVVGQVGKGVQVVMKGLSEARLLIAAAVLGACVGSYNSCLALVERRRAFGRRVSRFPSVQDGVARMLGEIFALESLCLVTAALETADEAERSVDHGIARLFASEVASTVLEASRELHGASAYGEHQELRNLWADCRALTLLDGSDYALHSFIALELTRELREELIDHASEAGMRPQLEQLGVQTLSRLQRKVKGAFRGSVPGAELDELGLFTERFSDLVHDLIREAKGDFIELQHVHRRIALLLADLSTWLAIAGRLKTEVERHGETGSRRMIDSATVWLGQAKERIRAHLQGLNDNADSLRNKVATRACADKAYPFEVQ